jgi:membrane associated rhomboid family serine protease
VDKTSKHFINSLKFSVILTALLWIVHVYKYATNSPMAHWGIFPREVDGLIGIITAPFIHGSWEHLSSNSVPLFVTMTIIYFFYKRVAIPSFVLIHILTGAAVWLLGRSVYHIGASGVVYGLIAFIFGSGIFRRNIKSIILALVVTVLYSGYLQGVLPLKEGISWESHLLGGIVGLIVAWLMKGTIEKDEVHHDPWANEDTTKRKFLDPDTFERTRAERLLDNQDDDFLSI